MHDGIHVHLSMILSQQDFNIEYFRDVPIVFAQLVPGMMKPLQEAANSLGTYFEDPTTKTSISACAMFSIFILFCFAVCIFACRLGYLLIEQP